MEDEYYNGIKMVPLPDVSQDEDQEKFHDEVSNEVISEKEKLLQSFMSPRTYNGVTL